MPFSGHPYRALTPEEGSPFGNIIQNMMRDYQNAVKASYTKPTLAEELKKAQLYNKWYGPNIQSEIGLRGAQASHLGAETQGLNITNKYLPEKLRQENAKRQYLLDHPYMNATGEAGQIAQTLAMMSDPKYANFFGGQQPSPNYDMELDVGDNSPVSTSGQYREPRQTPENITQPQPTGMTPSNNNLVNALRERSLRLIAGTPQTTVGKAQLEADIAKQVYGENSDKYRAATAYLTKLQSSQKNSIWNSLTKEQKNQMAAYGQGVGLTPDQTIKKINSGMKLEDIVKEQGYNSLNEVTPIYPLTNKQLEQKQQRAISHQETEIIDDYVTKNLGDYINPIKRRLLFLSPFASAKTKGKVLAARMLQVENLPQKIAALGGNPTVHAIKVLMENSLSNIDIPRSLISNEAYKEARKEFTEITKEIQKKVFEPQGRLVLGKKKDSNEQQIAQNEQNLNEASSLGSKIWSGVKTVGDIATAYPRGVVQGGYELVKAPVDIGESILEAVTGQHMPHLPNIDLINTENPIAKTLALAGELRTGGKALSKALNTKLAKTAANKIKDIFAEGKDIYAKGKQKYSEIKAANPEKIQEEFLKKQGIGETETTESNAQQIRNDIENQYNKEVDIAKKHLEKIPKEKILKIKKNDVKFFTEGKIKSQGKKTQVLEELINNFLENPTFDNAHKFRSDIGLIKRGMHASRAKGEGIYSENDIDQINQLQDKLDGIIEKNLTANQNKEWFNFKQKWSKNVVPYNEEPGIAKILSKTEKITPTDIQSTFEYPNPKGRVAKIAQELSKNTRNRIAYQKQIGKPAEKIPEIIKQSKETKGLGKYIGEEHLKHAAKLEKAVADKELYERLKSALIGGLAGSAVGIPGFGALAGLGKKELYGILMKILAKK